MNNLKAARLDAYLEALSAKTSTPGGGAVAALNAAEAAALTLMMLAYSRTGSNATLKSAKVRQARNRLVKLADDDMAAFGQVMKVWKSESNDKNALKTALIEAAAVPARVIDEGCRLVDALLLLHEAGNKRLLSDLAIAADLLRTALAASDLNIYINLANLSAKDARDLAPTLKKSGKAQARLSDIVADVTASLRQSALKAHFESKT